MAISYLLIGGNLGNRKQLLKQAIDMLAADAGTVLQASAIYESPAWGMEGPDFLNQALKLHTDLSAAALLGITQRIESDLGRTRAAGSGYSSRTMDIDILLYDRQLIATKDLTVPHPAMAERRFVLAPLNEIAGQLQHPQLMLSIAEMLANCPDQGPIAIYNPVGDEA